MNNYRLAEMSVNLAGGRRTEAGNVIKTGSVYIGRESGDEGEGEIGRSVGGVYERVLIQIVILIMLLLSTWPFNMTDNEAAIIIPTFVTILVFVLGLLAKWGYDHIQKHKAIKTFRKVVFEWTDIIIDAIRAQSQSLTKLSNGLNKSQSLFPESYAFLRSMSDKLSELTAEKVVSVFIVNSRCKRKVEDKRAKHAFNLVSLYDFLASVESIVKEVYDQYNQQANDLREQWNTLLLELQHEMDAVKPDTTREYQAIDAIRSVVNNYMKHQGQIDLIGEIYTQLIIPLNQTVDACKKSFPEVRCCQTVYECAMKMLILYNNWFAMKTGYAKVFDTYSVSIDKSVESLQGSIQYYKESTKVRCWPQ